MTRDRPPSPWTAPASSVRFEALDSLRGVSALCVALCHLFRSFSVSSPPFFDNGWLFVSLFFVLSGFVLSSAYAQRLESGRSVGRFMLLRFGRIYPLHLAVLAAMVAVQLARWLMTQLTGDDWDAFGDARSPVDLLYAVLLIQIFLRPGSDAWNGPSWSIAAEMWTYLVFASVCWAGGRRYVGVMVALALASGLWLGVTSDGLGETTSLLRCFYSFGLGVLTFQLMKGRARQLTGSAATLLETVVIAGAIAFVTWAQHQATFAAPFVFALLVAVFSLQRGALSAALLTSPLRWLGLISYSIYMVHLFILLRLNALARFLQGRFGGDLIDACPRMPESQCFALHGWTGAVVVAVFVATTLLLAWLAFAFVEQPWRLRFRLWFGDARSRGPAETADEHAAF